MPRAIWSGSISFGLVNVPVKLVSAVRDKDVQFHLLHQKDGARIQMKRFCTKEEKEVPWDEVIRGYPLGKDQHVPLSDEELASVAAEATRTIDIVDFVELKEIDPLYFDKPYYLIPDKASAKSYGLLLRSMDKAKKVAIARVVMREKEHLVVLRAGDKLLLLETMRYAEEVVPEDAAAGEVKVSAKAEEREIAMAQKLIETLLVPFDPTKYENTYRQRVLKLVEKKAEGEEIVTAPAAPSAATKGPELMDALRKSIEEAKKKVTAEG